MLTVPSLLGLDRWGAVGKFGAAQGSLNALTDQPFSVRRLVPFLVMGAVLLPNFNLTDWDYPNTDE